MADSHATLIARALNKDSKALEHLLFLRYDWLIAVARRTIPKDLWEVVEAEDVVQDASIKIFTGFESFEPAGESALFQWMQTITQHVAIDHLRRLGKIGNYKFVDDGQIDELLNNLRIGDPTASTMMQREELLRAFMIALEGLEPNYRRTIELLYLESKPIEEVARIMGKSESAIRGYRQRAREKLRESIIRLSFYV